MKNIFLFITLLLISLTVVGQSTETNTSQEPDENVNTSNNTTVINLFNIDLDGKTIPINLIYSHKGVKINDNKTSLGYSWQIQSIGEINKIVNDNPDETGWFTQPDLDYSGYSFYDTCLSSCPNNFNVHTPSGDLSPDFFSCNTSSGLDIDFLYKKNYPNNPIPVLLSNDDGYKINTNFSNFITNCTANNNEVIKIIDPSGVNYEFINGPPIYDIHRSGGGPCRNNFYLKTIRNSNNTENVSIDYNTVNVQKQRYYQVGFNNQGVGNYDFDNDIVNYLAMDYYFTDETRQDIKKIISTNAVIDFVYSSLDGHLDEINITDSKGKYITGYKFEYNIDVTRADLLWQIKEYSVNKTTSDIIYQFEYFNEFSSVESYFGFTDTQYEDYFGYCNGVYKDNLFPYAVRESSTVVKPAGNYSPDLNYAKQLSLKKITNKYGGITEFDYRLNFESHFNFGDTYGGGILISSKKNTPLNGIGKLTFYDYQDLTGYVILTNDLGHHFIKTYSSTSVGPRKFYTQIPTLDFPNHSFGSEPSLQSNLQQQGNFYKTVIETNWDLANMSSGFQNQVVRDYVPDYTGLYLKPNLKKETFYNVGGYIVKTNDYEYSYESIETINRATFHTEVRVRPGGTSWYNIKHSDPISINRVKLLSEKESILNPDPISITTSYSYINSNSSIIRSTSSTESNGPNLETKYFYATDLSLPNISGEPYLTDLISSNIVNIPLLIQSYRGTEKLLDQKTVYGKDTSTSNLLLPKYILYKKGVDSSTNLFQKKTTFNLYDTKGNVLQYTPENGIPISIIWGYNKTIPIAKLFNVQYSSIPATTITGLQSKSDDDDDNCLLSSCKQEILRTAINLLRNDFPSAMVSSWTYDPLIGKTSETDFKGDVLFYEYEEYNRIKNTRDKFHNILSENQYHFSTQN